MNIEELLETIKDRSRDYVGMNGCLYQDITREELDLIVNEIERKDKAIEYIKRYETINGYYDSCYDGEYDTYSHDNVKEELLDILKGSDSNE